MLFHCQTNRWFLVIYVNQWLKNLRQAGFVISLFYEISLEFNLGLNVNFFASDY